MSQCTRQNLTAAQLVPVIDYLTDRLAGLLQLYLRNFQSPEVHIGGLDTVIFDSPTLKQPAVLVPCYTGCNCQKARIQVKNLEIMATAPKTSIGVKGYFVHETIKVRLRKISLDMETDCKGYVKVNSLMVGALDFLEPGRLNPVGFALRRIPHLLWYIRNALRTYVVGKKFTLPVREGRMSLPLLCSPGN